MTTHHSHRFARVLVAGLAAGALAAPAAVAQPIDAQPAEPEAPNAPVVQTIDQGFDWGSAAIGAGGAGAAFILVTLGGVAYVTRGRTRVAR
jgi:negative regulator of sigma E activity